MREGLMFGEMWLASGGQVRFLNGEENLTHSLSTNAMKNEKWEIANGKSKEGQASQAPPL
jgi:hypothetical protein